MLTICFGSGICCGSYLYRGRFLQCSTFTCTSMSFVFGGSVVNKCRLIFVSVSLVCLCLSICFLFLKNWVVGYHKRCSRVCDFWFVFRQIFSLHTVCFRSSPFDQFFFMYPRGQKLLLWCATQSRPLKAYIKFGKVVEVKVNVTKKVLDSFDLMP